MYKRTYYVEGMHCLACEAFIERSILALKGIERVKVSLADSNLVIHAVSSKALPSLSKLNQIFNQDGYNFSDRPIKNSQRSKKTLAAIGLFTLIILLFFIFERSPLLSFLYVESSSNLLAYTLFGVAAGFSSCAALVGSLLLAVQESWVDQQSSSPRERLKPLLLFNGARLFSFAVFGGLLGAVGSVFQFSLQASAGLTIIISIMIFIIGMQMLGVKIFQKLSLNFTGSWISKVTNQPGLHHNMMPALFGMITFFVPCGFTLIAQSQALRSGNFIDGMAILLSFALGTLPVLVIISLTSVKFHKNPKFASSFRLLSGLLIVFFSIYTISSQVRLMEPSALWVGTSNQALSPTGLINGEAINQDTEYQLMQMEARGFEYVPDLITIKSGLPTRFEITRNDAIGCANAVYARGLYPDVIFLNPGLNVVEFIAPGPGTYQISCSMWMVNPITVVVE